MPNFIFNKYLNCIELRCVEEHPIFLKGSIKEQRYHRIKGEDMSQTRIIAFNNKLRDIITIVANEFPEDRDLEYTRSQIELSISVSPRMTITTFMQSAQPYLEKISRKDEDFFLKVVKNDNTLKDMKLHEKWGKLTEEDREKLWRNVQKMVILGDKILSE